MMVILCIAYLEEREGVEKLERMKNGLVDTFPLLQASQNLISLQQQRLHKSSVSAVSGLSETLLGPG